MSRCDLLLLSKGKAECDTSKPWGCPKHKNKDMITPECWRLRRLEKKEAMDQVVKERIYRMTKLRCPFCKGRFEAREGLEGAI